MTCSAPCSRVELAGDGLHATFLAEWQTLLERSYDNRVFFTPTWFRVWWEHFGSSRPIIVTHRDEDGTLQALLPLQIVLNGTQRVVTLAGDYSVTDYMDGLAYKPQAQKLLRALWDYALSELAWDRLDLRHVPSSSPLIPALQQAAEERGLEIGVQDDEVCPVAILCSNWEGYLQMLTKKQRHEIRRKLRRAQEGVPWDWRTVRTPDELERDLPIFFRLHEASGKDKARFMTPNMRAYFQAVAAALLDEGILRLSVFRRDGVDVAATLSFLYRNRYLLYNSGYDPSHAASSPGIAAVAHAMQDAITEKAVAFDFLSGDEPYKYQFGASDTRTCRVSSEP